MDRCASELPKRNSPALTAGNPGKYLRRVPNASNPAFAQWHEVDEKTAIKSVKLGIPKSHWNEIPDWFDRGLVLGNAFAFYRKCNDEYAAHLIAEKYEVAS